MTESPSAPPGPQGARPIDSFLRRERERVDAALDEILPPEDRAPASLHRAMRYSVFAGGKRLRPILTISAGVACGSEADEVLPAACAIELIHTYSLIHDDLPSFDDEELRRGVPANHRVFGEAVAVLAGDALQALAFETMASAATRAGDSRRWSAALAEVARAAGSAGMCGGQCRDIEAVGHDLALDALETLHAEKTGAMLTASVMAGGYVAGASESQLAALRRYGACVGLAFQIVDDILDVEGSVEELGKRPGGDADRSQPTFPSLIGLGGSRRRAERLREEAVDALEPFGDDAETLRGLAGRIVDRRR